MAKRSIGTMRSVFAQLAVFRTDDETSNYNRAVHVAGVIDTAKTAAARYKAAVEAHPDLSAALCRAFRYEHIGQWTGYVPAHGDSFTGHPSDSPYRAILVEIVTEALKRGDGFEHGDSVRLATVPRSLIREPWKEDHHSKRRHEAAERLQAMTEDEDDEDEGRYR